MYSHFTNKKIGITLIFSIFFFLVNAQRKDANNFVNALNVAFRNKTDSSLKEYLDSNFSIGIYSGDIACGQLRYVLQTLQCDSIIYKSTESVDTATTINIDIYNSSAKNKYISSKIYLNAAGKILYADFLDSLYNTNRHQLAEYVTAIPFDEEDGSIYLKTKINDTGKELRLLFDTGADGMALPTKTGEELNLKVSRTQKASIVGGYSTIKISTGNTVQLGQLTLKNQNIALFDNFSRHADGIIGNTLLRQYIVKIDYSSKELKIYTMGKYAIDGKKGFTLPIELNGNLLIPFTLELPRGKRYTGKAYFDTGASYDFIAFRPFVLQNKLLVNGFKSLNTASTTSMGINTPTFTGVSHDFRLGNYQHAHNMLVTLMGGSSNNQNWTPDADGSIGIHAISRYNTTIDLLNKKIYLEPNAKYGYPSDFIIGDYMFSFNIEGALYAKHLRAGIPGFNESLPLTNAVIKKINDTDITAFRSSKTISEKTFKAIRDGQPIKIDFEKDKKIYSITLKNKS